MMLVSNKPDHATVVLPDGRTTNYAIQFSTKLRSIRIKISARDGLVVIAPQNFERKKIIELVSTKSAWILEKIVSFDRIRHLVSSELTSRPQAFDLPALAESWLVEYKLTRSSTVGARIDQPGRIVVSGCIDDIEACHAALRRWLARHAKQTLSPLLNSLAKTTGLTYSDMAIKNQRTRWGSCSSTGRISLNCKLLFLPRNLVRYVILHELCHLIERNHSERFWMHLRSIEPLTDALHGLMSDTWKFIPHWAITMKDPTF